MVAGRRILIVEDEPIIALALEDMLADHGADVYLAERLDEAFMLFEREPVDAAILDVNVHGHRSYPLAQALLERRIPFIFATGYGDSSHPPEFCDIPTIAKPYRMADIERALGRAVDPSREEHA